MVKISCTRPALTDLYKIFLYISNNSTVNERHFVKELKSRTKILKSEPEKGGLFFRKDTLQSDKYFINLTEQIIGLIV